MAKPDRTPNPKLAAPTIAAEILTRALDVIDAPEKWTQGSIARTAEYIPCAYTAPAATCFCAMGAIRTATRQVLAAHKIPIISANIHESSTQAIRFLTEQAVVEWRRSVVESIREGVQTLRDAEATKEQISEAVERVVTGIGVIFRSTPGGIANKYFEAVDYTEHREMIFNDVVYAGEEQLHDTQRTAAGQIADKAEEFLGTVDVTEVSVSGVPLWNDEEGRTYEEVVAMIAKAAESAKAADTEWESNQ